MSETPTPALVALLHAAALSLFPLMMGLSTTMCLAARPSPYSIVAVHEYVTRTRSLDRGWLVVAVGWLFLAFARSASLGGDAPPLAALALPALTAAAVTATVVVHLWYQATVGLELAAARARVEEGGDVSVEDADGMIVALRRRPEEESSLPSARRAVRLYLGAAVLAASAFIAVSIALGAAASLERSLQCLLLAGLYCSLGILLIDLVQDVWPGTTTKQRLEIAARYYTQVFEQWVNYGVLVSFLIVLLGGPAAWMLGYASVAVISFPVWIGCCLVFANVFNRVLRPRGIVQSRLPLPVYVNEYSVARPLWAHFFTVIHVVMAAALAAGLVAVSRSLG